MQPNAVLQIQVVVWDVKGIIYLFVLPCGKGKLSLYSTAVKTCFSREACKHSHAMHVGITFLLHL